MKALCLILALTGLVSFTTLNASAGALADKKTWDNADKEVAKSAEYTKTQCGGMIPFTVDKASFKTPEALKVASWCHGVIDGVGSLCGLSAMKDMKPDIVKAIKSVTCHYDAAVKNDGKATNYGKRLEKKGSDFHVFINENSSNVDSGVRDWLQKEL